MTERPRERAATAAPSQGAVLGGVLLVGAAAGYALIALRFKNMHAATRGAASAEMKAAQVMSEQASRVEWTAEARAEGRAATEAAAAERARRMAEQQEAARRARERARRGAGAEAAGTEGGAAAAALGELGLHGPLRSLTPEEIKQAYHAKARECHPDVSGADPVAFKRLNKAYQELQPLLRPRGAEPSSGR